MASITVPAAVAAGSAFEAGAVAAPAIGLGLADAAAIGSIGAGIEGLGLGAGALGGTLPGALVGVGDITGGALAAGGLGGGLGAALGGGGSGLINGAFPILSEGGGLAGVPGGAPLAGGGVGSVGPGAVGGASASAAPVTAPVAGSSSGLLAADTAPSLTSQVGSIGAGGAAPSSPIGGPGVAAASTTPNLDALIANPSVGNLWNLAKANPSAALSAAGLGMNLLKGNGPLPGQAQLEGMAGRLGSQGAELQTFLQSGQLPPGLQNGLTSASAAAKATIRSRHAAQGTAGSSAEQQELASVDNQMTTQGAQMALSLFQAGLNESQIAAHLYQGVMQGAMMEDEQLGQAIGRFASSLVPPTINLVPASR